MPQEFKKIRLIKQCIVNRAKQKVGAEFDVVKDADPQEKKQVSLADARLLIGNKQAVELGASAAPAEETKKK